MKVTLERQTNWMSGRKTWEMDIAEACAKMTKMQYHAYCAKTFPSGKRVILYSKPGCLTQYRITINAN